MMKEEEEGGRGIGTWRQWEKDRRRGGREEGGEEKGMEG